MLVQWTKKDNSVGTGMVGAPACGDVMQLQIKVNDSGIIEDAKFKTKLGYEKITESEVRF